MGTETSADDETFARAICAERNLQYLSHESYQTLTSHEVWIAVADCGDRFELKLPR